ncbi:hypothetical protein Tco_1428853 [Tanacetum coccineum]
MVQKQIEEDKVRQLVIMNLAVEYDNASIAKDELRNAYEKCNDIPQEKQESVYEHEIGDEYLTEKEHQLLLDEETLRETLEEEARAEKEWEE